MDTTALAPRVLVIGLDPYRAPGGWDPELVVAFNSSPASAFDAAARWIAVS